MHVAMDSKGPSYAPVDAKLVPRLMPRPAKLTSEEASFFSDLLVCSLSVSAINLGEVHDLVLFACRMT
jgi:hypothetical protein